MKLKEFTFGQRLFVRCDVEQQDLEDDAANVRGAKGFDKNRNGR
jgi:hypothetical protein